MKGEFVMSTGEEFLIRKKKEISVSLNQIQRKAVLQTKGLLLLLASPGSGKTTTIIMRIGYLYTSSKFRIWEVVNIRILS